jgi:putative membrane protein
MHMIFSLLLSTAAVAASAYLLPGVHVTGFWTALGVAVVLGIVNALILPLLLLITLPINILSLGLFSFVIIALMVLLVGKIVPGFTVDSFWWALVFALVLAIINGVLKMIF